MTEGLARGLFAVRRPLLWGLAAVLLVSFVSVTQLRWVPEAAGVALGRGEALRLGALFAAAVVLSTLLAWVYVKSVKLAALAVGLSLAAVLLFLGGWQLAGAALTPPLLIVPYLIFALALSHALHQINTISRRLGMGDGAHAAATHAFRSLIGPGGAALLTDAVAFLALLAVPSPLLRPLAISAAGGMAAIFLCILIALPLAVAGLRFGEAFLERINRSDQRRVTVLRWLTRLAHVRNAIMAIAFAGLLAVAAGWNLWLRFDGGLVEVPLPLAIGLEAVAPAFGIAFGAVFLSTAVLFRDPRAVVSCLLPLLLATLYAVWALAESGLSLSLVLLGLVVVGIGIGVDFAFYLYAHIARHVREKYSIEDSFAQAVGTAGSAVIASGVVLGCVTLIWLLAPGLFLASAGATLGLLFLLAMTATVTLLPALAVFLDFAMPRKSHMKLTL